MLGRNIRSEVREVAIERAIFLQDHDDVLDALQSCVCADAHSCLSRGGVALAVNGGGRIGGILRGRNDDASVEVTNVPTPLSMVIEAAPRDIQLRR